MREIFRIYKVTQMKMEYSWWWWWYLLISHNSHQKKRWWPGGEEICWKVVSRWRQTFDIVCVWTQSVIMHNLKYSSKCKLFPYHLDMQTSYFRPIIVVRLGGCFNYKRNVLAGKYSNKNSGLTNFPLKFKAQDFPLHSC